MRSPEDRSTGSRLTGTLFMAAVLAVLAALIYPLLRSSAPPGYAATTTAVITYNDPSQVPLSHLSRIREHSRKVILVAYVTQQAQQQAVLDAQAIAAQAAAYVPPPPKPPMVQQAASPPPAQHVSASGFSSFESCVISRESGGDPTAYNSSSGASGLFGFLLSTWLSTGVGYPGGAYTAPASVQEQAFSILYARDGTSPWAPYDGCTA